MRTILMRDVAALWFAILPMMPRSMVGQSAPTVATISKCDFANAIVIAPCKIAYRTYGRLNGERSNAVLVPTWLLGRSDEWAAHDLLGPQAAIDTVAFFTIVVDALANGYSQSPSNTDAAHRRAFDALTIGDMVTSQYRLLTERLGVNHLHAIVGASMGGMQAFEWGVRYPTFVDRIVPIVATPRIGAYDTVLWTTFRTIIDDGERGKLPPDGIWLQLGRLEALTIRTPRAVNRVTADSMEREIAGSATGNARASSLEDYRAQLGAILRHDVAERFGGSLDSAAKRVRSRVLMVYSWDDHFVTADATVAFGRRIAADSTVIASECGHLMVFCETGKVAASVRHFLAR